MMVYSWKKSKQATLIIEVLLLSALPENQNDPDFMTDVATLAIFQN